MRIGVEVEYWLVDDEGDLVAADGLAADCPAVDREFVEPLVEVATPPCDSLPELVRALRDRLGRAHETARSLDLRLVSSGTPLTDEAVPLRDADEERTAIQRAVLGDDLRHATHCAGTHLHVEQVEGAVADQLRVLTALDPAFALVNTAPYYRGRRIATCARPAAYRRRCYRRLPDHGQLWRYPASVEEWRDRVDGRFERFADAAASAGVDRETVAAHFAPADAVWSPVRLRDDLGTVEWRAPDASSPLELCRLVGDVTRIVERAVEAGTRIQGADGDVVGTAGSEPRNGNGGAALSLPPFGTLRGHVDAAIERGLSAGRVERHLAALGFDTAAYRPSGGRIDGRDRLDAATARRLRLRRADRLEADLRRLRGDGLDALGDATAATT